MCIWRSFMYVSKLYDVKLYVSNLCDDKLWAK
jgi:hypothetical protein